jgi:hypothetical protein
VVHGAVLAGEQQRHPDAELPQHRHVGLDTSAPPTTVAASKARAPLEAAATTAARSAEVVSAGSAFSTVAPA